jgi:hypothetical protein
MARLWKQLPIRIRHHAFMTGNHEVNRWLYEDILGIPPNVPVETASPASSRFGSAPVARARPRGHGWTRRFLSGLAGLAGVVFIWWLAITLLAGPTILAAQFSPTRAAATLPS